MMVAAQSGQVIVCGAAVVHRPVPSVYFPGEAVGMAKISAVVVVVAQATNAIVVSASEKKISASVSEKETAASQLALAQEKSLLHATQYRSQHASNLVYWQDL